MKNLKEINAKYFIMSLMIFGGVIACEKADVEAETHNGRALITLQNDNRGGDDDEEPILQGIVENSNGNPVANADVQIFVVGSNTPYTSEISDIKGEFTMTVPAGSYFFKVISNGVTTTTNSINVNGNMNVTLVI